ncbi:type II toxin-antitoxin system Phd/YefM family antitoxin [Actinospica durhamensis]|uniref:Antitoxin n=1 Tax=Actinospica durhamensis TaxID=1508375 RepID=A0A941EML4_9ACTN|nr:type II toxin-antitoxin system Phd/YefM family antitoxin [Actinospica durhamensis]MBR7833785.1 type II toxin-antitoxin system Phd/YefM family antitoxin [Actinospica durhamensis]
MTDTDHRSIEDARAHLGRVVRDASAHGRRTVIIDGHDAAVVMSRTELENLEDAAALAQWRAAGSPIAGTLEDLAAELGIEVPDAHERVA